MSDAGLPDRVPSRAGGDRLLELLKVMHRLRGPGGCPWDREQTHRSLARHRPESVSWINGAPSRIR